MADDSCAPHPPPHEAAAVTHQGGMRAQRVFPTARQAHLDPFVVFERFFIDPTQGFGTHPHRGFEIVSYMLDGGMVHEDSLGHTSTATTGDAMRITTGSGMSHSELPADGAACNGLQLWVNLPRAKKGVEPSYQDVSHDGLPVTETDGATVTTVVGDGSPLDLYTPVEYHDVQVSGSWEWVVPDGWNGFLFVVDGEGRVSDHALVPAGFLIVTGGGTVEISTERGVRLVVIAGAPHGEPIRQRGPFVD